MHLRRHGIRNTVSRLIQESWPEDSLSVIIGWRGIPGTFMTRGVGSFQEVSSSWRGEGSEISFFGKDIGVYPDLLLGEK